MSKRRKTYSAAEKAKIALEAIKGEKTIAQICAQYEIHATQVNTWKKQLIAYLPDAFSDKDKQVATFHEAELAALYEQIGRLKVELDYLKKKSVLFND